MPYILIRYTLKWQVNFAPHYQFTTCKKLVNTKTGKILKKVSQSGSIGYVIQGKFYSLSKLRNHTEKIIEINLPF